MPEKIKAFKGTLKPIFDGSIRQYAFDDPELDDVKEALQNFLPVNLIQPRQNQPRKFFDESLLEELAESIRSKGVIQPIIVRPGGNGIYEIVVGERRWRASKKIGLDKIPVVIKDYDNLDCMAVSLIENIQRDNLNPLEEASAIQELLEEHAMTHAQVAEHIGKSRTAVSNLLRLLSLEPEVKDMVYASFLEMGHAKVLLSLSGQEQVDAAKQVIAKSLSVRETEKLVQGRNNPVVSNFVKLDPNFEKKAKYWKKHMSQKLASKVNIHFAKEGKGKVVMHFDSIEEAEWLMDHIEIKDC